MLSPGMTGQYFHPSEKFFRLSSSINQSPEKLASCHSYILTRYAATFTLVVMWTVAFSSVHVVVLPPKGILFIISKAFLCLNLIRSFPMGTGSMSTAKHQLCVWVMLSDGLR